MKYIVIVSTPGADPKPYELKGKRIGLGREVDNNICVVSDPVSSSHLEFQKVEQGYELVDLSSTNGTRVNGKIVQKTILEDGDRILIAETVPAHFVILAEGEKLEDATADGTPDAAEYASMADRLDQLEANIGEKEEEAARLEEKLVALRNDYAAKLAEFQKAQEELTRLEAEIAARKEAGGAGAGDMEKMEADLMHQTQKVKVMASDLAAQEQTIAQMEQSGVGEVPRVVPPARGPVMPKAPPKGGGGPGPGPGPKTVKLKKAPPRLPRVPKKKSPGR